MNAASVHRYPVAYSTRRSTRVLWRQIGIALILALSGLALTVLAIGAGGYAGAPATGAWPATPALFLPGALPVP
jgi:NhaP-type Na+/H+ or K+/H+ antiporter